MTDAQDANRGLERLTFRARPSFETVEVDGWILRFTDGYTKRANSVNPHFGSTASRLDEDRPLRGVLRRAGAADDLPADAVLAAG